MKNPVPIRGNSVNALAVSFKNIFVCSDTSMYFFQVTSEYGIFFALLRHFNVIRFNGCRNFMN